MKTLASSIHFTGGVPKYIEQFMDRGCTDMESMVDLMLQPDSSFLTEGTALLIQEFGERNMAITFSEFYRLFLMVKIHCGNGNFAMGE